MAEPTPCGHLNLSMATHTAYTTALAEARTAYYAGDRDALARAKDAADIAERGMRYCVLTGPHDAHRDAEGNEWGGAPPEPEPGRYRHYYGFCEADGVLVQIEVMPDAPADARLPDREDWEDFGLRCPVCGDTVPGGYEGADNMTTDDERDKRLHAEAAVARTKAYIDHCAVLRTEPTPAGLRRALNGRREGEDG